MQVPHPIPHVPIRERITVRLPNPGALVGDQRYRPLWQSQLLDTKGRTLIQAFIQVQILTDTAPVGTALTLAGRLIGSYSSSDVPVTPLAVLPSEAGAGTARRTFQFPTMQAKDTLATLYRFQLLGFSPDWRVLHLQIDGMLASGTRSKQQGVW